MGVGVGGCVWVKTCMYVCMYVCMVPYIPKDLDKIALTQIRLVVRIVTCTFGTGLWTLQ